MTTPSVSPVEQPVARFSGPTRGIAVASVSLGYLSMVVFWWYPFSLELASVGFILGVVSMLIGLRGGIRGENLALVGTCLCGFSLSVIVTLNLALRHLQWLPPF
jgi:hypothetical protein